MKLYRDSIISVFLLFLFFGCKEGANTPSRVTSLPYYQDSRFTPTWLRPESPVLKSFHKIPSFKLVNQDGMPVTEELFNNKIYVANFMFTSCPGICPKMTSNMGVLQDKFSNDDEVLLLSHSVTPEIDSVPVLKSYAEEKGAVGGKWHLVTGDRNQIYDLGRNFYFVEEDLGAVKAANDFLHTENFVLVDKKKHIRGVYNGINTTSVKQLIEDINTLKLEN